MHLSLAHHPYAKLSSGLVAEIDKAREVSELCVGGKGCDVFSREYIHECLVGARDFAKKSCRLLPLPFPGDVAVLSSAELKNRQKVTLVAEIVAQRAPGVVISRS